MQLRPHQERALEVLASKSKGQVIIPTGGGKTLVAIKDAVRQCEEGRKTIVVVAPRILLARQLCEDFREYVDAKIFHCHSGYRGYVGGTNSEWIAQWHEHEKDHNRIIHTTYHSLHRLQEAGIKVDTIYFDEAHNSTQRNFIEAVEYFSLYADRCYFFTATPKYSYTPMKVGMNESDIFGEVICKVPAPELVKKGYILPPKVAILKHDVLKKDELTPHVDCEKIIGTIKEHSVKKVLICAKATKQIVRLVSQTDFCIELNEMGYNWMYITSKTGAVINGEKVSREKFFEVLNRWGKEDDRKFIVLHHSILSEGINVSGLEAVLFMRSMDYIGISQTIGRVIRKGSKEKTYGLVCVPIYSKVGISTARRVQAVVDTVFNKGEPAISVVKR